MAQRVSSGGEPLEGEPPGIDEDVKLGESFGAPGTVRELAERLFPLYYEELHRVGRRERRRLRAGETLATTAVIHEAFLRLREHPGFTDRLHFLRASALAMRHALLNYAARKGTGKRGGGITRISLDQAPEPAVAIDASLLAVNEALKRLAGLEPRLSQVVECRFFAGYSEEETAEILGLSRRTVIRDWVKARAWLYRELGGES